ncbi:HNH endonuclease [Rosenbergiella epipactidis]|uniref:HNH endonuclease n=1 Tax=Rosenbergiella epipactidis TaxID=1544694 RepID=UPI001F4D500F|nr:HNH endonuclease [Rosenbergiella epipactidis]
MPKINKAIDFSQASTILIKLKMNDPNFTHNNWGDDELIDIRNEIRDYHRKTQRLECVYCLEPISTRAAHAAPIEHIAPKSQYFNFIFEPKNLCVICPDCNEYKGKNEVFFEPSIVNTNPKIYPRASSAFRIVHPHIDEYEEHIIKLNRIYIDRTKKGNFTIGICKLNRFYHLFGACDELIEDSSIMETNDLFFNKSIDDSNDIIKRALGIDN